MTNPLERDALLSLLAGGRMEQSRGPMMRNPTPDWLKRENDSVFDSMPEKAAKALLRLLGADDPSGQVIGIAAPVEVPGGVASPLKRAADAVSGAVKKGIKAFHGSPHDFDQFSLSKIGTGEGAQAYGHGLYFAEGEDVATGYRNALAPQFEVGGKPVVSSAQLHNDPEAINRVQDLWGYINSLKMDDPGSAKLYAARLDAMESTSDEMRQLVDSWQRVKAAPIGQVNKGRGHMYEVSINADPEDFLDWDAPLSQQSEKVRQAWVGSKSHLPPNAMDDLGGDLNLLYAPETMPQEFLNTSGSLGRRDLGENILKQAGIPGIKYLDGASRPHLEDVQRGIQRTTEKVQRLTAEYQSSPTEALANRLSDARQELESAKRGAGDLKRNYVVFDDKLISIVKKYGIAAALSAGAINETQAKQMKEQGYQ